MSNVQSSSGLFNVRLFLGADRVVAFLSSRSLCQGAPSFSPPTWPVVRPCGDALGQVLPYIVLASAQCWLLRSAGVRPDFQADILVSSVLPSAPVGMTTRSLTSSLVSKSPFFSPQIFALFTPVMRAKFMPKFWLDS